MATASMILFGLNLTPLFYALAEVESNRGITSENVYQIRDIYIDDLNRIYTYHYSYNCKFDKHASERMMYDYWNFYGRKYNKQTGNKITYEVLARIHNGGPNGWAKISTMSYWMRVKRELIKQGVKL